MPPKRPQSARSRIHEWSTEQHSNIAFMSSRSRPQTPRKKRPGSARSRISESSFMCNSAQDEHLQSDYRFVIQKECNTVGYKELKEAITILRNDKERLVFELAKMKEVLAEKEIKSPEDRRLLRLLADARKELHEVQQEKEDLTHQLHNAVMTMEALEPNSDSDFLTSQIDESVMEPVAPKGQALQASVKRMARPKSAGQRIKLSVDSELQRPGSSTWISQMEALHKELNRKEAEIRHLRGPAANFEFEALRTELARIEAELRQSQSARAELAAQLKQSEEARENVVERPGAAQSLKRTSEEQAVRNLLARKEAELRISQSGRAELSSKLKRSEEARQDLERQLNESKDDMAQLLAQLNLRGVFLPSSQPENAPCNPSRKDLPVLPPPEECRSNNRSAPNEGVVPAGPETPPKAPLPHAVRQAAPPQGATSPASSVRQTAPPQVELPPQDASCHPPGQNLPVPPEELSVPAALEQAALEVSPPSLPKHPTNPPAPQGAPHRPPAPPQQELNATQLHHSPKATKQAKPTGSDSRPATTTGTTDVQITVEAPQKVDAEEPEHNENDPKMTLSGEDKSLIIQFCELLEKKIATPDGQIDWGKAFDTLNGPAINAQEAEILSKSEFMNGLNTLGTYSMSQKLRLHQLIDRDRSGLITRNEWAILKYYNQVLRSTTGEHLRTEKKKLLEEEDSFSSEDLGLVDRFVAHLKQIYHTDAQFRHVDFEQVFRGIDNNGNGLVSAWEFRTFLHKVGWVPLNTSSQKHLSQGQALKDGRRLFKFLDKDKSGLISIHEVKLLEYYVDYKEKLDFKASVQKQVQADLLRVSKYEEEKRLQNEQKLNSDMERLSDEAQEIARQAPIPRSYSEEMLSLGDEGWIELDDLAGTLPFEGLKFTVAVDGSETSISALHLCTDFWISRHRSSHVSVAHIADPCLGNQRPPQYRPESVEAQCESWLVSSMPKDRWKVKIVCKEPQLKTRKPLTDVIREEKCDFLFAGSIGSKGAAKHKTLGSTAMHLLSNANVPVMLVPKDAQLPKAGEPCHHVVVVYNDQASFKMFIHCLRLAGHEDRIDIVHVAPHNREKTHSLAVLRRKYERLIESITKFPENQDPKSLPGMLQRGGPWPTCKFAVLQPLPDGDTATLWTHIEQVGADFAYIALRPGDHGNPRCHDFIEMMTCPVLVSHFSRLWHVRALHRRHASEGSSYHTKRNSFF